MVPQSLLRRFAAAGTEQLFAYDKEARRAFPVAVSDAAAERDFYSVEVSGQWLSWEPAFQRLDDRLAECVRELTRARGARDVAAEVRADLPLLVATQLLRTKLQRTTAEELASQIHELAAHDDAERTLSTATIRLQHLHHLLDIEAVTASVASKDFFLLRSDPARGTFIVSDNPVVLHNSFPYGRTGLDSPGIEIYLPIGPLECLAYLCPSIPQQIAESLDPRHPRPPLHEPFFPRMLEAFTSGCWLEVPSSYVDLVNRLQVLQSSRFVYAGENIQGWIEAHFAPAVVRSLFRMGELGLGPPPLQRMPPGASLIVERGTSHHVLAVTDLGPATGGGFVVATTDLTKLAIIQADSPFDSVTLVVDGRQVRGAREVEFVVTVREGSAVVAVRHVDQSLQELMDHLQARRTST